MNNNKINDYKKILRTNFITLGAIAINILLTSIGWWTTFRLENWHGYVSWSLFLFGFFSPFYNVLIFLLFLTKAINKRKNKDWKKYKISTNFWNISNIFLNLIIMIISCFWFIQGCLYFLHQNLIQAIFIIVISIFSLHYTTYYFYFQSKIKKNKINISCIFEIEKLKKHDLFNNKIDTENK